MANFLDHQGNDSGFTKEQWCESLHPLIKAECEKRILSIMPEWKQRNIIADLWSDDEVVEAAAAAEWAKVTALRAKSNEIETGLPSKTDAEVLAFDPSDDAHWE